MTDMGKMGGILKEVREMDEGRGKLVKRGKAQPCRRVGLGS